MHSRTREMHMQILFVQEALSEAITESHLEI